LKQLQAVPQQKFGCDLFGPGTGVHWRDLPSIDTPRP
jgi:hypothetical protein